MKKILIIMLLIFIIAAGYGMSYPKKWTEMSILEGSQLETKVYTYNEDPKNKFRFVIIGGIHGNETAGIEAAQVLMKQIPVRYPDASVLIVPQANYLAARENVRFLNRHDDLNRCFSGTINQTSSETEKLAYEIMKKVKAFEPAFVIDHHESLDNYLNVEGKYQLGNTIIVTDNGDNIADLLFILDDINHKIEDDIPFILESNPPKGSFNEVLSNELGVFVGTIETNRKLDLDKRIEEQLIVANEIIKYFQVKEE